MAALAAAPGAFGQTAGRQDVAHAVRVLKNLDTDMTKEQAVAALETAAAADSGAYAMNCLGLAYMAGVGTGADSAKAVAWLERAGRGGYANAYHNLGIMYKYGKGGVRQDFSRAYAYFCAGADSGSVSCTYDKGFMLYKGLGCRQDYAAAVGCFRPAAERSHKPSLYMLGLCYRNGYGVEKDTAMAMDCLRRSAALGFREAREEIERPFEETYLSGAFCADGDSGIPEVSAAVNDPALMGGCWQGHLVLYDWSGQHVIGEKPLAMSALVSGREVSGSMVVGADSVPFSGRISTGNNSLVFTSGRLSLPERYSTDGDVKYRMDNMTFDVWNNRISGRLNLYSLKLKEPERPMYFELRRDGGSSSADEADRYSRLSVAPNPFVRDFSATFELKESADVVLRVFNIYGMMVWQKDLGRMSKGGNTVSLSPDIRPGKYILNIKAGGQTMHAIIIKEGGM